MEAIDFCLNLCKIARTYKFEFLENKKKGGMMNIFLVARKEYDIGWGAYSKEFANVNEAVKKIRDL
jgi:hypothetical protein